MKAKGFDYERPQTLDAVLTLLEDDGRDKQLLAGGQSLMPMMNFRLAQPELLVDLNEIEELRFIRETENTIEIGAMTRYVELENSALIAKHVPLFIKSISHIAHSAIRNRGTIGGSAALADPAAEMPALLTTLDATFLLVSKTGEREVSADDFFVDIYETALEEGEIIKSIRIAKPSSKLRFGFYELARRHGDYAMAGVAIAAGEPALPPRITFFAIGPHPLRALSAEKALTGKLSDDDDALTSACESLGELEFVGDMNASEAMKEHLAKVVLRRAWEGMTT